MWKIDTSDEAVLGLAAWQDGSSSWALDARGGEHGISMSTDDKKTQEYFQLKGVDGATLPTVAEQFVRGNELHLWLPQGDGTFGIRLALEPIHSDKDCLLLETTISIQTDLLDTHPMLDICVPAGKKRDLTPEGANGDVGSSPISVAQRDSGDVAVLLGPHDSPFTTDRSGSDKLQLRLFGDFLEKGVIRKARPWFALCAGDHSLDDETLTKWWGELQQSPLPLAP